MCLEFEAGELPKPNALIAVWEESPYFHSPLMTNVFRMSMNGFYTAACFAWQPIANALSCSCSTLEGKT